MAEADQRTHGSDSPTSFKLPSFISNFLKPKSLASVSDSGGLKPTGVVSGDEEAQNSSVFFPHYPPKKMESLKFESEGSSGRTSNPFVLWQVYALGGFLVLKWAWARWNERNQTSDKKKTTDDDDDDDDQDHPSQRNED